MMSEVKIAIISLLKEICPNVYNGKSSVIYPKINLWIKLIDDSTFRSRYVVVLDLYTKGGETDDVEVMAESVEKLLTMSKAKIEGGYLAAYKSGGGGLAEYKDSEKIFHYVDNYEVIFYKEE